MIQKWKIILIIKKYKKINFKKMNLLIFFKFKMIKFNLRKQTNLLTM